jgi:hypothetical protein
VVSIAIKVVAKQSSVRCEQLFNTGPLNLDGDVKQGTSAFLDYHPTLLRTPGLSGSRSLANHSASSYRESATYDLARAQEVAEPAGIRCYMDDARSAVLGDDLLNQFLFPRGFGCLPWVDPLPDSLWK